VPDDILFEIVGSLHPKYQMGLMTVSWSMHHMIVALADRRYKSYGQNKSREILIRGDVYNFIKHPEARLLNLKLAYRDPELALVGYVKRGLDYTIDGSTNTTHIRHQIIDEIRCAIDARRPDVVRSLLMYKIKYEATDAFSVADIASLGHVDLIQTYITKSSGTYPYMLILGCYESGSEVVINWVRMMLGDQEVNNKKLACLSGLCRGGHVNLFEKYIIDHEVNTINLSMVLGDACKGGCIEIIKTIINRLSKVHNLHNYYEDPMGYVCVSGNLAIFTYMRSIWPAKHVSNEDHNDMLRQTIMSNPCDPDDRMRLIDILLSEIDELALERVINWAAHIDMARLEGLLDVVDKLMPYYQRSMDNDDSGEVLQTY